MATSSPPRPFQLLFRGRSGLLRDGLSINPAVEALAGLLSELPGADHRTQDGRRPELIADLALQVLEDRKANVETDEVGQLERPHRVPIAELHAAIDVL